MLSDEQIVRAIKDYRDHPRVQDRHGPRSLDELAYFLARTGATEQPRSKQALSQRLHKLVDRGLLATGTHLGVGKRFFTTGLYVTQAGREFLGESGEDVEEA